MIECLLASIALNLVALPLAVWRGRRLRALARPFDPSDRPPSELFIDGVKVVQVWSERPTTVGELGHETIATAWHWMFLEPEPLIAERGWSTEWRIYPPARVAVHDSRPGRSAIYEVQPSTKGAP